MALSKEEKDALHDHYKDKDIYDPSKAPEQEVATFQPKGMCGGGMTGGYADGGQVEDDEFGGPSLSAGTDTAKSAPAPIPAPSNVPFLANFLGNTVKSDYPEPQEAGLVNLFGKPPVTPPQVAPKSPAVGSTLPPVAPEAPNQPMIPMDAERAAFGAPASVPAAPPTVSGLAPDQFDELIKGLKPTMGQRLAQGATSGLAGLADAIQSGVGRAPGPGFQKNIAEQRQNQKENLIKALREKYEAGYRGKELEQGQQRIGEEARFHKANEAETEKARVLTQQQQDLALRNAKVQQGIEGQRLAAEENKTALEQADKTGGLWNKAKGLVGLNVPGPDPAILARAQGRTSPAGPVLVKTHSDYMRLPAGTHYVDSKGKQGVK